jgi:hypothetical protein
MMVSDEVEDVLFKVRARAANCLHFVLANHLSERMPKLSRAHGACDRDQHFATLLQVSPIAFRGVLKRRRIEVSVMPRNELGNGFYFS